MRVTRSRSDKQFTYFEKRYRHLRGTALKNIVKAGGRIAQEDIDETDHWPCEDVGFEPYTNLLQEEIHTAVYHMDSANEWQQFRVSLKGLKTKEKLYCLLWRWVHDSSMRTETERHYEIVRIQNYLGALTRSGHLNVAWRVVN